MERLRCISSADRLYIITRSVYISFRNDEMQDFVLMKCNFFEIDDMHGFAVTENTENGYVRIFYGTSEFNSTDTGLYCYGNCGDYVSVQKAPHDTFSYVPLLFSVESSLFLPGAFHSRGNEYA